MRNKTGKTKERRDNVNREPEIRLIGKCAAEFYLLVKMNSIHSLKTDTNLARSVPAGNNKRET